MKGAYTIVWVERFLHYRRLRYTISSEKLQPVTLLKQQPPISTS